MDREKNEEEEDVFVVDINLGPQFEEMEAQLQRISYFLESINNALLNFADALKEQKKRDYKREYARDHASKKAKVERASRNKARRSLAKSGRVQKGDGKDVDHRDGNPRNNSKKNLRVISKSKNRSKK